MPQNPELEAILQLGQHAGSFVRAGTRAHPALFGGGRPRCESILLAHLLVPMLRVGDELSGSWIHDEVQVFQWNLAQEVGHIVVNFHL